MLIIPIKPVPSQIVTVQLANQYTQINLRQRQTGLFLDLYLNNSLILAGALCESFSLLVQSAYLGFVGDLGFIDNRASTAAGSTDPYYTGLGSQFSLAYLEASDLV